MLGSEKLCNLYPVPQYLRNHVPQYLRDHVPQYLRNHVPQYLRNHVPQYSRKHLRHTLKIMYYVPQTRNYIPSTLETMCFHQKFESGITPIMFQKN